MIVQNDSKEKREAQTSAGLAGAGGGTLVAVIANQIPDSNIAKPVLQYMAPSISILITALWVWLQVTAANHVRDMQVDALVKTAKVKLEESIANPHISEEHRSYLRKQLEQIDSMNIDRIKSKIEAFKVITSEDIKGEAKSETPFNSSESTHESKV
ncbi:MAG: hypothetical protein JHC73_15290 [Dolichospermum sp.]|nr:hypothetical protein [Dolichospermum sp.]